MTTTGSKRLVIVLSVALVVLLAVLSKLFWSYALLQLRVKFASEQVHIFEDMRINALLSNGSGAAQHLEYVVHYYPSGTKQIAGSPLDRMVERQRVEIIRVIIAHLRERTGEDLGDDPEKWIQKYAHPEIGAIDFMHRHSERSEESPSDRNEQLRPFASLRLTTPGDR